MAKIKTRADRRRQDARLKKARTCWWGRTLAPAERGKALHTPSPCSCWMCTSPRYGQGVVTMQERRVALTQRED